MRKEDSFSKPCTKKILFMIDWQIIGMLCLSGLVCVFMLLRFHIFSYLGAKSAGFAVSFAEVMNDNFLQSIYVAKTQSGLSLFGPLFSCIVGGTFFCEHYKSGYIDFSLVRLGKSKYEKLLIKMTTLIGGIGIAVPCSIVYILFAVFGDFNYPVDLTQFSASAFDETVYCESQFIWNGIFILIYLIILDFVYGALWASVGLMVSCLIPNKYIAVSMPLMVYLMLHLLFYRLNLVVFSPVSMVMPAESFIPYQLYPLLYQLIALLAVDYISIRLLNRRLSGCIK